MAHLTVIITGASRGLGRATALTLASAGASLVLNARTPEALAQVRDEVQRAGGRACIIPGSVGEPETAQRLVAAAQENFGGIDVVINNAGVLQPVARIADTDPIAWQQHFQINVMGPYLVTRAALPTLRLSSQPRVITISSGASVSPMPGWSAYCSSKAAVNMFTAVLAAEEPQVTAVALRPGVIDTYMQQTLRAHGRGVMPEEQHQRYLALHQEGKLMPPEVPARAVAALALFAPRAWSGQFIQWNSEAMQALMASL